MYDTYISTLSSITAKRPRESEAKSETDSGKDGGVEGEQSKRRNIERGDEVASTPSEGGTGCQ